MRQILLSILLSLTFIMNVQAVDTTQQEVFIERFYQNILNRTADSGGMNNWLDVIQNQSATQVAMGFLNSSEFNNLNLTNEEFLDVMYQTMFDRTADDGGKSTWLEKMNEGRSKQSVMFGFFRSEEFKNLTDSFGVRQILETDKPTYAGVEAYVNRFYNLVLKREAEEVGFGDWVKQLNAKTKSPIEIASGFLFSSEYTNQNEDDSAFLDTCYKSFFGRDADDAGKANWLTFLNTGATRQEVFDGFTGSEEFLNLVDGFNLDADSTTPVFTSSDTVTVQENQIEVLTVKASDVNKVSYALSGNDASNFNLNASTGLLSFKNPPDYEIKKSYSLTIIATDIEGNNSSQNLSVNITDVNENRTNYVDFSFDSNMNKAGLNLDEANFVLGKSVNSQAYLFDGNNVKFSPTLGKLSELTISMDVYINDLKERETVLFDSGSNSGGIKLTLIDNRASQFKNKDVAFAFEVIGNSNEKVETKYRRFMEHELEYMDTQGHERRVNQLWLTLALTYNPVKNTVDFFINGIHDSTQKFTSSNKALLNAITLGSSNNGNNKFYGKISNLKIEDRILSNEEIYHLADFRKDLWAVKYEDKFTASRYLYVDGTNGNDNSSGSETSPYETIGAAVDYVNSLSILDAAGTHIIIKPGIYREGDITLKKNGSVYKPIVIEAQTPGTVIISGSEILDDNSWSQVSNGLWKHSWIENYGRHAFQLPSKVDLDTEVRYRKELVAVDGNIARPYPSLDRLKNSTLHADADSFLSDDHAFYINEGSNLIYLRSTKNPNNSLIEIGKEDGLLTISSNYVVMKGLTFKHDASFQNSYSSISGEAVMISGDHIFVEDCNAIDNGSDGIVYAPGSDLVVRGGEFINNGRAGIITRRGYANAYLKGITVSYNQWRNDLSHYTSPDLSGYGKVMFSSRIYIEDSTVSHHKNTGIWFDAHNTDITLDNSYFTQNNGAVWFEISQLNHRLINSTLYDNNVTGIRVDSENVLLKNNVMSQSSIDGAWGIVTTLYRDLRAEQMTPDVYLGKWLRMEDNIIAVKSGSGKIFRFNNTNVIGTTATSKDNTLYAPTISNRIYAPSSLSFYDWQDNFNDTTSTLVFNYPFANDNTAIVEFENSFVNVEEKQMRIEIPITLSKAIDAEVTMDLSVVGTSATKGDDFTVLSPDKITFRPLERKKMITILVNRDYVDEGIEEFSLSLSNPSNAMLGIMNTVDVSIMASNETLAVAQENSHNAFNRIEAENFNDSAYLSVLDNVGFGTFRKNHWAMYQNVNFGTSSPSQIDLNMSVPKGLEGRTFEVRIGSSTGEVIATFTTTATDSNTTNDHRTWDIFETFTSNLTKSVTGVHDVYITNNHDHTNAGLVNWFVFQ